MDKVTVSRAAQGLVKRRLVGRTQNKSDGRSHMLALTAEGRSLYGEIAPLALAYEAALIAGLAPEEVTLLKRLLGRLQSAAGQLSGEAPPPTGLA
jgi:DNA-binding MarR family transcriptional regulator